MPDLVWPLPAPDWAREIDVEGTLDRDGNPMAFYYGSTDDDHDVAYLMRIDTLTEYGVMLGPLQVRIWLDGNTHDWEPKSSADLRRLATALLELSDQYDHASNYTKSTEDPATSGRQRLDFEM